MVYELGWFLVACGISGVFDALRVLRVGGYVLVWLGGLGLPVWVLAWHLIGSKRGVVHFRFGWDI